MISLSDRIHIFKQLQLQYTIYRTYKLKGGLGWIYLIPLLKKHFHFACLNKKDFSYEWNLGNGVIEFTCGRMLAQIFGERTEKVYSVECTFKWGACSIKAWAWEWSKAVVGDFFIYFAHQEGDISYGYWVWRLDPLQVEWFWVPKVTIWLYQGWSSGVLFWRLGWLIFICCCKWFVELSDSCLMQWPWWGDHILVGEEWPPVPMAAPPSGDRKQDILLDQKNTGFTLALMFLLVELGV